ncbi:unnamed protein product [Phytophthora lilii]|uniref:Unnamed protein product n=1 Tax=Phytophthora lilii TaxID=2077276 RepID=A0A9W6TEZ1_9STRA|nr:unnamed protein product [Phytophthora lilii]
MLSLPTVAIGVRGSSFLSVPWFFITIAGSSAAATSKRQTPFPCKYTRDPLEHEDTSAKPAWKSDRPAKKSYCAADIATISNLLSEMRKVSNRGDPNTALGNVANSFADRSLLEKYKQYISELVYIVDEKRILQCR